METTQAISPSPDIRVAVAIDLIGDLDATLGAMFSDTLSLVIAEGATDVVVTTKHAALSSDEGMKAIDDALGRARSTGCSISVEPGTRRMKAAFSAARIAFDGGVAHLRQRSARHLMIARHASQPLVSRSA